MRVPLARQFNNFIDSRRPIEPEVLECYQNKMPDGILVKVNEGENKKFWAEIFIDNKGKKDILYTQASDRNDLEEMVNDAVATYFEVPFQYANLLLISKKYNDPALSKKPRRALKTA